VTVRTRSFFTQVKTCKLPEVTIDPRIVEAGVPGRRWRASRSIVPCGWSVCGWIWHRSSNRHDHRYDALLEMRQQPAPPVHATAKRQPDLSVMLCHSSEITFPLICQEPVGVVVDQAHFSSWSFF